MSFSRDVRNQVSQLPIEKMCCRQSQLLALTVVSTTSSYQRDGVAYLLFSVDNAAVARHLFKLGKAIYGRSPRVETLLDTPGQKHASFRVLIPLEDMGRVPTSLTFAQLKTTLNRKACCRRAFLRGAFMGCGSLVTPHKAYHLEFNAGEDVCAWLVDLLHTEGLQGRAYQRSHSSDIWTVYVKDGNEIAQFLSLIGAHQALIQWEEVRVGKDLVNNVQRVVNCETANLNRTLQSAERQVKEIQFLLDHGHLNQVPDDWRAIALARLELPYASLTELGRQVSPPLSKSAVNHRLRLLHQHFESRFERGTM